MLLHGRAESSEKTLLRLFKFGCAKVSFGAGVKATFREGIKNKIVVSDTLMKLQAKFAENVLRLVFN